MVEAHLDTRHAPPAAMPPGGGFYRAPFLEEVLFDLTLAIDMGGPVFLLGAEGGGKSALVHHAAERLGGRYRIAWLEGRPRLTIDEVVDVCRGGFDPEVWRTLTVRPGTHSPSANLLIVENAETISPRFIEQLVAASNGYQDLMPSYRILLAGHRELVPVIEASQLRNNWGAPRVLQLPPWPDQEVAPFLRHRMQCAGVSCAELVTDAVVSRIAREAGGNPRRILELAQDMLRRKGYLGTGHLDADASPVAPPPRTLVAKAPTTIDVELASSAAIVPLEMPASMPRVLPAVVAGVSAAPKARRRWPAGLLAGFAAAVALGAWGFDRWPAATHKMAPPAAVAIPAPTLVSQKIIVSEPVADGADVHPPPPAAPAVATPAEAAPPPEPPQGIPPAIVQAPQPAVAVAPNPSPAPPLAPIPLPTLPPEPEPPAPVMDTPAATAPPVQAPIPATFAPEPPPPSAKAPPEAVPVVVAPPVPPHPAPTPPPQHFPADDLFERGTALLRNGDFASARLFYMQAVRAGSARAATAVAWTYDPQVLSRMGVIGSHGDPAKALEWYRKAVAMGDDAAAEPLHRLSGQ